MKSHLDNMHLKEQKEIVKWEVIQAEDNEIRAWFSSLLFEEKVVKRAMIDKEDDKIEVDFGIPGAFMEVDDVEFDKKRVVRLGFEAHAMVLKTNNARMVFLTMVNKKLTFLTSNDNWTNGKIGGIFSNQVERNVKKYQNW